MSLQKIGNLTKAFNAYKDPLHSALDDVDIVKSLADFDNINDAAKYLKTVNSDGTVDKGTIGKILSKAFTNTTEKDAKATYESAGSGIIGSLFGGAGLKAGLSSVGSGLLTVFKSIAPIAGAALAIGIATKLGKTVWDEVLTNNGAKKRYETSSKKYSDAQSELSSLQSQYNTNQDRIYELRAKKNRSTTENAELSKLRDENTLLDSQLSIKSELASATQKQSALDAKAALEKSSLHLKLGDIESVSDLERAQNLIKETKTAERAKNLIEKNRAEESDSYFSKYQEQQRDIDAYDKTISKNKETLADLMSDISDTSQSFWDDQGNLVDNRTADTADQVKQLLNDYSKLTDPLNYTEDKIKNIFAKDKFKDVESQLSSIAKNGTSKDIENQIDKIDGLSDALADAGINAKDLSDYIMSIANPDKKSYEGVMENFADMFGEDSKIYDFLKGKKQDEIIDFWDYLQNNNLDPVDFNWNFDDVTSNFEEMQKAAKNATKTTADSVSTLVTETSDNVDKFQTNISDIKSAMDSLKSGETDRSGITDLIQKFPELASKTDNLENSLRKMSMDKTIDQISELRKAESDKLLTATGKKNADRYVQSILDNLNTSDYNLDNKTARLMFAQNMAKNSKSAGSLAMKIGRAGDLYDQFTSRYGVTQSTMQTLIKLSLDPSNADSEFKDLKSKYEDTNIQVKIDLADQDLENLSKDLTRLQTDASDMQTEMSNKAALNQKVTAQDYNNLISNGSEQIKNLNKQIKDYQDNIDSVKNSKLILTDEDNEKIKGYQDQIQSAQMSIENMKASQAGWLEEIQNLPITDVTNLASALSTAIGETNSETGLTSDSVKNLVTQFSDLTAQGTDISNLFSRSADGLKLNTERFKDLSEIQNQMVMDDFAKQIKDQQDAIADGDNIDAHKAKLEELKNLQAEYMDQYEDMQSQLSDFQIMQNSKSEPTEGSEYTQAKSDLEAAKKLYDQGLTGTPQFKKTARYFSQGGFEDADNFIENYNSLKKYYTDDASGPKAFLEDLQSKGLATYETLADGNKQWSMSFSNTEDAANQMGMSLESFESILGRLGDYDFVNTFVKSIADGENQIDDLTNQLITEQKKLSKMRADGASEQQIKDQEEVVNGLQQQISDTKQATEDYAAGEGERQAKSLAEAKQQINDLAALRKDYLDPNSENYDTDAAEKIEKEIQNIADEKGIKLKVDSFEVDENAYNQLSHEQGIGTFDSPLTAEEMGISDPTAAKEYANSLEAVKQAHEANAEATEADFNALRQYTAADLEGIQLGDGAYNVEGMEQAEDALQNLANQAGLTKDQLVQALEGLGVLKPEVDSSEIEEAGEKAEETSADLQNLSGSTYTIEADLSTSGGTEDLTNSLASIPQGTTATVDVEVDGEDQVENLTSAMESVPDNTPVTITCDVQNQEELDAINAKADELNGQGKQITVNATIKKDSKDVDSYKPADKEGKAIYHVNASEVNAWTPPVKGGTVNYTVNAGSVNAWTPPVKGGTVIYHAQVVGAPSGGKASGTMTSIAHADGTAYNMLNLKPLSSAHAGGNVALNQNETALTNEVGTESIVRDGVWSLLPGGPHFENLKKGDIIFNASQTKDLLEHGRTNSNARAYASGTLSVNAYRNGSSYNGGGAFEGGAKKVSSANSSSSNKKSSGSSSSKSSSKSSGKSKSSSSSKDSEQDVDYIEIKFKRLERVISNFGKIASDTFRSLGNRLDHLTKVAGNKKYDSELELLKSEKNTATKAVSYYLKKANGVKLDAATKKKIREGAIDYRTYSSKNDEKYKNIKKYQTFYEKSLDARDKQLEIEENIAKLFSDRFDMISTDFDNDKALIEHRTNTANNNIDYLEEKGYLGSKANYSAIASATQDEINKSTAKIEALKAERAYALSNPYSGIVKDSEQDKEFQKAIQEEIENRQELNTQLAEANNNMRQVDWDRFDYIQERISDISSEADFMIDLMAQRKDELYQDRGHTDKVENANVAGKFTDKGVAVMGLHGQNYNTYMAQANQYAEEIKKLNAEIAKDPNNTKLIDRRKELLEAQRDNIKSAEDEKQAMADLIEDGINRQIDALGTLIDEYEDSIDSAKDLYDYQKKVKDQTEEISKIQKQLNAYSGDDSEESKANIQKLKEDLKDAQEDLQDTQYDRYISEQKKLLSDLSDNYKETLNARLDNIDALVADMITKSNDNKESINQTLQTEADKVGYTISDEMSKIWGYAGDILGTTDDKGIMGKITGVKTVLDAINAKVQSMQTNSDKQSTQVNEGAKTDTALPAKKEAPAQNNNKQPAKNQPAKNNNGKKQGNGKVEVGDHVTFANGSYTADSSGGGASGTSNRGKKVYVTKIQKGAKKPYHISTGKKFGSGDLGWVTKSQLKGYKTGGLVDYTGLAQLDGTPSKPELVLNSVDTENFLKLRDALRDGFDFTPNMNTPMFANTAFDGIASQIGRIASASSKETTIGNVTNQVTIQIDHVENYEDFMNQMTKDDKFEKFIQSMTTDRLAGGSKLAKNKYKW